MEREPEIHSDQCSLLAEVQTNADSHRKLSDPRSLTSGFEPRPGYIRRMFHLSLRSITVGGPSSYTAYLVHKSGRKISKFTFLQTKASRMPASIYRETKKAYNSKPRTLRCHLILQ